MEDRSFLLQDKNVVKVPHRSDEVLDGVLVKENHLGEKAGRGEDGCGQATLPICEFREKAHVVRLPARVNTRASRLDQNDIITGRGEGKEVMRGEVQLGDGLQPRDGILNLRVVARREPDSCVGPPAGSDGGEVGVDAGGGAGAEDMGETGEVLGLDGDEEGGRQVVEGGETWVVGVFCREFGRHGVFGVDHVWKEGRLLA